MRALTILTLIAAAPAFAQAPTPPPGDAPRVTPFSKAHPGATFPSGWGPLKINDQKKPTSYDLVEDQGVVVLHAAADGAASLLGYRTSSELQAAPVIEWRWKVKELIATADNTVASKEDSPVRIVLEFEGDKSKLSLSDRATLATSKALSGRELPHSTLMYIWSNKEPVGKVIRNPHTTRVQMVVASSGAAGVGAWQSLSRNALEDFRRAFKDDPGKLTGVAVLTDTDNTGEKVEAWYGDISFHPNAR
jgi:Protein of unknown function (DUF3047)